MNVVLFEDSELGAPLPLDDPRAIHVTRILRRGVGDTFDAGVIDGPMGKATIEAPGPEGLVLRYTWGSPPPPLDPITLLVGLARPQTSRKILQEAATLGVGAIIVFKAERSEPSYAASSLWSDGEWRRHLVAGAAQAFSTRLPSVRHAASLSEAIALLGDSPRLVALDNYEAEGPASVVLSRAKPPIALALGPERGWTGPERLVLRGAGASLAHLGSRVLRTETALCAAVTLAKASLGLL